MNCDSGNLHYGVLSATWWNLLWNTELKSLLIWLALENAVWIASKSYGHERGKLVLTCKVRKKLHPIYIMLYFEIR